MPEIDYSTLPHAVLEYRPRCPGCTPDAVTAAKARPCSFYDCSGFPKELDVTCNTCMYDFATEDGQVKCDHSTCETAVRLKSNVETYRTWVHLVRSEAAGHG